MMRLIDISVLAVTKLRTRRIRTGVTIVLSSLLFGCLVAALCVAQGAFRGIDRFNALGLGSRYLVQAQPQPVISITQDKDIQARALQLYNQMVADKKAAAKKLDITYDPATDRAPVLNPGGTGSPSGSAFLDLAAPASQQAVAEYLKVHPLPGADDLRRVAAPQHPQRVFTSNILVPSTGTIAAMKNGVEDFSPTQSSEAARYQDDILQKSALQVVPRDLAKPFMLPVSQRKAGHPDAIPIIVPYGTAEQILGLKALPKGASSEQKLARMRELYRTASSGILTACYRNGESSMRIQQAIATAADIAKNKNNKDYQMPSLIYGLPAANSCGAATIARDTRTADEKTIAAKQKQFDAMFGVATEPVQQKIELQIVGLTPDPSSGAPSNSAAGILQSLVGSSLSGVLAIPQDMYDALPSAAQYKSLFDTSSAINLLFNPSIGYVEFGSDAAARAFINTSCNSPCTSQSQPFTLNAFGSNSIALRDLQRKVNRILGVAALIVIAIAIVIMTGTVGRMVADSRRETAVFRAVGAERLDIAGIYVVYTTLLSIAVAVFALGLGLLMSYLLDWRYWQTATAQAQLAFGGSNAALQFRLFSINNNAWWVLLAAIGTGLASTLLPLLRNVRRSPINDMRDE